MSCVALAPTVQRSRVRPQGTPRSASADALGVSYEALRKRMQRSAKAPVSQVCGGRISDIQRLPHTWDKDVKSPPDLHRQHLPHLLLIM